MTTLLSRFSNILIISMFMFIQSTARAENALELDNDPHYNQIGFFDIHICNWPERPNYFKILFSSEKYQQIESMSVYTPDNQLLANLDRTKFRTLKRKNKANKRVYLLDLDVPEIASTGWYKIDIKTKNGSIHHAKDYVIMTRLEKVSDMQPSDDDKEFNLPITLKWKPVAGSQYYQAYVRDAWTEKLVFRSKLIDTPEIKIPKDKLEPGGDYYWRVHSRDTNEHVLLGDFSMGSMSEKTFFTVAE